MLTLLGRHPALSHLLHPLMELFGSLNARGKLRNGQTDVVISLSGMGSPTGQNRQISETTNGSDKVRVVYAELRVFI